MGWGDKKFGAQILFLTCFEKRYTVWREKVEMVQVHHACNWDEEWKVIAGLQPSITQSCCFKAHALSLKITVLLCPR